MPIFFYKTGEAYDIFSNVTDIGFQMNIGGKQYHTRSSEAVYQGMKALSADSPQDKTLAANFFADTKTPGAHLQTTGNAILNKSFKTGNTFFQGYHNTYTFSGAPQKVELKEQIMYETLLAKFTQNLPLLKALLETGTNPIIENTSLASYNDDFWGNGKSGNGKNALGIALMRVREDLNRELQTHECITIRDGFSHQLTNQMGIVPSTHSNQANVITPNDLNAVHACTTVAEFKSGNSVQNAAFAASTSSSSAAPISAEARVLTCLQNQGFQANLQLVDDINKPGEKVVTLNFSNANEASRFVKEKAKGYAILTGQNKNIVILGPNTQVFQNLGIGEHGKTHPHKMFDALVYEEKQKHSRTHVMNMYAKFSSQQSSSHAPTDTLTRLRKATHDSGLSISVDSDKRIQLHFSNANAANNFSQLFGKVWRDPQNSAHFSIGVNQETFVFTQLQIPTHGTKQYAFGSALKFDHAQLTSVNQPSAPKL